MNRHGSGMGRPSAMALRLDVPLQAAFHVTLGYFIHRHGDGRTVFLHDGTYKSFAMSCFLYWLVPVALATWVRGAYRRETRNMTRLRLARKYKNS